MLFKINHKLKNIKRLNLYSKFQSSFIHNSQMKTTQVCIGCEWINILWQTFMTEPYSAIKRNKLQTTDAHNSINIQTIMLSERSQPQRTTYCMISLYEILEKGKL